jgi:predicted transcriptional regulator
MRFEQKLLKNNNDKSGSMIADFFLLLSRSTPWLILHSLRRKGRTLSEISKSLRMTQKAALPELIALQDKDILISFSKSQKTFYRLADDRILQALDRIHKVSQRKVKQAETKSPARITSRISRRRRA